MHQGYPDLAATMANYESSRPFKREGSTYSPRRGQSDASVKMARSWFGLEIESANALNFDVASLVIESTGVSRFTYLGCSQRATTKGMV